MDVENKITQKRTDLRLDVYRALVLGNYISSWGMPEYRVLVSKDNETIFEIYAFPNLLNKYVYHFSTIGIGDRLVIDSSEYHNSEYFMTLPPKLGGATVDDVFGYMADIGAYLIQHATVSTPRVIDQSTLAPSTWGTTALLIDEARGEDEDFGQIAISDTRKIQILWVIPVFPSEAKFILTNGIDAFDKLEQGTDFSLADLDRPPVI